MIIVLVFIIRLGMVSLPFAIVIYKKCVVSFNYAICQLQPEKVSFNLLIFPRTFLVVMTVSACAPVTLAQHLHINFFP